MVLLVVGLAGCDLLDPTHTENPDVLEDDFLNFPNAMNNWLDGMNRQMAIVLGGNSAVNVSGMIVPAEIASDNYINTETFFNTSMDRLVFNFTDDDVEDGLLEASELREMAEFGLSRVADADDATTDDQRAELYMYKAASHIYVGEWYHHAPADSAGEAVPSEVQFQEAVEALQSAIDLTSDASNEAGYHILLARAYRNLGDAQNARQHAEAALGLDADYVRFVGYDNINGPSNDVQNALYTRGTFDDLQPLIRLDFLDPKYFIGANPAPGDDEEADIAWVKAEEAHLIIAEAQLAADDVAGAQQTMGNLLDLVESRKRTALADVTEGRTQDDPGARPNSAGWAIAFSPQDTFHTGLVIPRDQSASIPVISGTAVTQDVIDRSETLEEALELVYRLRQEIFIAEGRRMYDLGLQWPVPEVEILNNPNITEGPATQSQVPSFLPPGDEFDAWASIDFDAQEATLMHNLNRILVENRSSDLVVPFF